MNFHSKLAFFLNIQYINLTLFFDGNTVYGAIGKLHDSYSSMSGSNREWEECQIGSSNVTKGLHSLTYYDYFSYKRYSSYYLLDVSVYPRNKPYGPSYDNDCANYKTQKAAQNLNVTGVRSASKNVKIQRIYKVCTTQCFESVKEELNVKVDSNQIKVVNINQTVASCDYGFKGCHENPRNLSLWINATGQLDMAIGEKRYITVLESVLDTVLYFVSLELSKQLRFLEVRLISNRTVSQFSSQLEVSTTKEIK